MSRSADGRVGPTPPGPTDDPALALDTAAAHFAGMDAADAESALVLLTTEAVTAWRLADATFWQRVKFRARQVRARTHPDAR